MRFLSTKKKVYCEKWEWKLISVKKFYGLRWLFYWIFFLFWKNNIHRKIIDLAGDASQIDWDQIKYFFNKSAKMCSSDKTDFVKKILYLVWINSSDVLTKINDFLMYIILPQKNPIKRPEKVGWSHFFKKSAKMFRRKLFTISAECVYSRL